MKGAFETTELFLKQEFSIAVEKQDSSTWEEASNAMKNFGQEQQRLQELVVKTTCPSVLTEFVNEFETSNLFINAIPVGSEFWTTPIQKESHLRIPFIPHFKYFMAFLNASIDSRGRLFKGNSTLDWTRIARVCEEQGKNLNYPLGYTQETKPPNGLSKNLGITITLLKFLGPDPRNYNELRKFLNQNQWARPQKFIEEDDKERLKSLGFMKQAILDNVVSVATHCTKKYVVEKKVIEWSRNENGNPDLALDLEFDYPFFPRCEKDGLNFDLYREEGYQINDKEFQMTSSKMTNKLHFALIFTLLSDALRWYNRAGPNTVFPVQEKRIQRCNCT